MIRALQRQHRTETQWYNLVEKIFDLEDVHRNIGSHEHYFKPSFEPVRSTWLARIRSPTLGRTYSSNKLHRRVQHSIIFVFLNCHCNRVVLEMLAEAICLSRAGYGFGPPVGVSGMVRIDILQCQSRSFHLRYFRQFGERIL